MYKLFRSVISQYSQSEFSYNRVKKPSLHSELDVRESMRVLPSFLQPFLTWLTGKPLENQAAWNRTPTYHLVTALISLLSGVIISTLILMQSKCLLFLLIPSWMLTVSGSRKLQSMISHQCTHFNFSGNNKIDRLLGESISIIITIRDFDLYKQDHVSNHHPKLSTLEDETVKFLLLMVGLRPGMTQEQLWSRLFRTIVSPKFHWKFWVARVFSTYYSPSHTHNIIAFLLTFLVIVIVAVTSSWLAFLVAWVFPISILYQISTCLRLCSEHLWSAQGIGKKRDKLVISRLTVGIFLGERTPDPSLPFILKITAWSIWSFRMIFIHLASRIFVMIGDTPCHDYHHRHPASKDWPNYIFARQKDFDLGCPEWPEIYTEVWGLNKAINEVFKSISEQPPIDNVKTADSIQSVYSLGTIANES